MTARTSAAFLLADPEGASARVRVTDRLAGLDLAGVDARAVPLGRGAARRAAIEAASAADVVVLERRLLGEADLVTLRRSARALVLDLDDATWTRPAGRAGALDLGRLIGDWRGRRRLADAARAADLVLVGNVHLRAELRRLHPRVRVVAPTTPAPALPARSAGAPGVVRLVWTGSASTLRYLERLDGVLAAAAGRAAAAGVDLRLDVVADVPARLPALGGRARFVPWSLEAEAATLAAADVGLYPLAADAWSQGKCAYKLRRYMAWGLPSVASRGGAGVEVLEAPEAGLLADDEGEWLAALGRLAHDAPLRRRLGARARGLALARDDHEARTRTLALALREAAEAGRLRIQTLPSSRGPW